MAGWRDDRPNPTVSNEVGPPYFDQHYEAWIFSRHQDVLLAFRSSSLVPVGATSNKTSGPEQQSALLKMREETRGALFPRQLQVWQEALSSDADQLVKTLCEGTPTDLLASYARPLCLSLASLVTGVDQHVAQKLRATAEPVSAAAAEPFDPLLRSASKAAEIQLTPFFHSPYETLRESGFVALAHTLPCLLASGWHSLLQHSDQWALLHEQPDMLEQGVEELFRHAGLTRMLFRQTTDDVSVGGVLVRKGERVMLRITSANNDPERFVNPETLDVCRRGGGHLSLGAGAHSCVGASLIRMAANTITAPLVSRFQRATLVEPVRWQGGSGFRSPASLIAVLQQAPARAPV